MGPTASGIIQPPGRPRSFQTGKARISRREQCGPWSDSSISIGAFSRNPEIHDSPFVYIRFLALLHNSWVVFIPFCPIKPYQETEKRLVGEEIRGLGILVSNFTAYLQPPIALYGLSA